MRQQREVEVELELRYVVEDAHCWLSGLKDSGLS